MLGRCRVTGIYLAIGATDLRKSVNGLSIIVQESFGMVPFNHALYVFCNGKQDKLKILHWEDSGFWLYYKRLEVGAFKWPMNHPSQQGAFSISERELSWLLDGLFLEQKYAHKKVTQRIII